jgi:hypothetical protein
MVGKLKRRTLLAGCAMIAMGRGMGQVSGVLSSASAEASSNLPASQGRWVWSYNGIDALTFCCF